MVIFRVRLNLVRMGKDGKKKEKRPLTDDSDSDSGPDDRAPLAKSAKKSLHKVRS